MKKVLFFLILLSTQVYSQDLQTDKYSNGITTNELRDHVKILASDEFKGRGTGQPGLDLAAEYIKNQFVHSGLPGLSKTGDPYFQEYRLEKGGRAVINLISGEDTLSSLTRIAISGHLPEASGEYELVFVGLGIDEDQYSDYKTINNDLSGKIVIFFDGEPQDKSGKYILSNSYLPKFTDAGRSKAQLAYEKGAVLAIRINPDQEQVLKLVNMMNRFSGDGRLTLPTGRSAGDQDGDGLIQMGIDDAAKILKTSVKKLTSSYNKLIKSRNQSLLYNSTIRVEPDEASQYVIAKNVVAFIEGTDLKDEWVVVTAHFDHLGERDGVIKYGADDNASGTAAVIEIAEAFAEMAKDNIRPRRSILFMPVSGEEIGLLGSRYYASQPLIPLEETKFALNMDMIGRSDKEHSEQPNYVYVYVKDSVNGHLAQDAREAASFAPDQFHPEFKYRYLEDGSEKRMGGSDHSSFEDKGIPVLYFYCGLHPDYHRSTDTWEKLEYEKMTEVSRLVFHSALILANKQID